MTYVEQAMIIDLHVRRLARATGSQWAAEGLARRAFMDADSLHEGMQRCMTLERSVLQYRQKRASAKATGK